MNWQITAAASFNPSFSSTLSSSMLLPLSTSSEEPASPLLTANAAGASRSAAMELLSSLRASLNRNSEERIAGTCCVQSCQKCIGIVVVDTERTTK